jgi:hypothetical protein
MGPVLLLAGIVSLLLGGAGLLAGRGAAHSRLRTARPIVHLVQIAVGVVLTTSGATVLLAA